MLDRIYINNAGPDENVLSSLFDLNLLHINDTIITNNYKYQSNKRNKQFYASHSNRMRTSYNKENDKTEG